MECRDAILLGRADDAPPGAVLIEYPLKVGYEYRTVIANLDVKVTVMPAILGSRVVPD